MNYQSLKPAASKHPVWNWFIRTAVLLGLMALFMANIACAQKSLKITKMRQITWDPNARTWSPWPTDWRMYPQGSQPILTITAKDNAGYIFHIDMLVGGQTYSFDVDYNGFDTKSNWTKYMDQHGDEISIVGSTLTYLSQSGWPANEVQIYFWIYSNNMALEME
jgi:hypothetical protein